MLKFRVLEFLLKRGEVSSEFIAKNLRVPKHILNSEIDRMVKEGLVVKEGERVKISKTGIRELRYAKRVRE